MENQLTTLLGLLIPLVVAIFVAAAAYLREQRFRRIERKHDLYTGLQKSLYRIWASQGLQKEETEALCTISDAWIFASDEVLRQVNTFMQSYNMSRLANKGARERNKLLEPIMAKLFLRLREDLMKTGLTEEEAKESVKFYEWVGTKAD